MLLERPPAGALAPWVSRVWSAQERAAPGRERMVPSGAFHIVIRLDDSLIRVFDDVDDDRGATYSAVIGGARSRFHVRQAAPGARSVGILLRPGAAGVVLGVPAEELAGRHTALDGVWGQAGRELRERLCATGAAASQLALLEAFVAARLQPRFAPHPAVGEALRRICSGATGWQVAPAREETGLSERRFVELFRRHVGIGPKQLCRVLRLNAALRRVKRGARSWADVAAASGYCDQSHLVREMRAIAGVCPSELVAAAARAHPHHIPVVSFVQDRARARG